MLELACFKEGDAQASLAYRIRGKTASADVLGQSVLTAGKTFLGFAEQELRELGDPKDRAAAFGLKSNRLAPAQAQVLWACQVSKVPFDSLLYQDFAATTHGAKEAYPTPVEWQWEMLFKPAGVFSALEWILKASVDSPVGRLALREVVQTAAIETKRQLEAVAEPKSFDRVSVSAAAAEAVAREHVRHVRAQHKEDQTARAGLSSPGRTLGATTKQPPASPDSPQVAKKAESGVGGGGGAGRPGAQARADPTKHKPGSKVKAVAVSTSGQWLAIGQFVYNLKKLKDDAKRAKVPPGKISKSGTLAAAFLLDGGMGAIAARRLYVPVSVANTDMAAPFPKSKALQYLNKQQTKSDLAMEF